MTMITLKKKLAQESEQLSPLAQQIDLVGAMQKDAEKITAQIKKLQEQLKPFKKQVELLQSMIDELDLDDDAKVEKAGQNFIAEIGPRGNSRSITNMAAIREFLGDDLFMQLATITLKNVDDYLTPPQKEQVLKTDRTSRSVKIVPKR